MTASNDPTRGKVIATWAGIDVSVDLLRALAQALHEAGQPAHRVEDTVLRASQRLQTPLSIFCVATGMLLSFDRKEGPVTYVLRTQATAINMERLGDLTSIAEQLIEGTITPADAQARIAVIRRAPPRWGRLATIAAYVLSAAAFSVFFAGGLGELAASTGVGLVVGILAVAMARVRTSSRLFELCAAAAAALVADLANRLVGLSVEWCPLAAGLIILLPGISLVDAMEELAHGHLASGGARLAGVGVVFLAMTFGTVIGEALADQLPGETSLLEPVALPAWTVVPALLVVALGSTMRFRARPIDLGMILISSIVAWAGSRYGLALAGPLAGPFLGSLLLGLAGVVYGRLRRRAPELFIIPGLALLVPGSMGLRSVSSLLSENTTAGIDILFHMFMVAMALVAGLLFSNSLLRERRAV